MVFSVTLQCMHTGRTDQIQSDLIYTHPFPGSLFYIQVCCYVHGLVLET